MKLQMFFKEVLKYLLCFIIGVAVTVGTIRYYGDDIPTKEERINTMPLIYKRSDSLSRADLTYAVIEPSDMGKVLNKTSNKVVKEISSKGNIESVINVMYTSRIDTVVVLKDSVVYVKDTAYLYKNFVFKDKGCIFEGYLSKDSLHFNYAIKASTSIVSYWAKENGSYALKLHILSDNPHVNIVSAQAVTVKPKPEPWYNNRYLIAGVSFVAGTTLSLYLK